MLFNSKLYSCFLTSLYLLFICSNKLEMYLPLTTLQRPQHSIYTGRIRRLTQHHIFTKLFEFFCLFCEFLHLSRLYNMRALILINSPMRMNRNPKCYVHLPYIDNFVDYQWLVYSSITCSLLPECCGCIYLLGSASCLISSIYNRKPFWLHGSCGLD